MPGVISVRFSKHERQELQQKRLAAGYPSLSAMIRHRLGFDPAGGMEVFDPEELDHTGLLRGQIELRDRIENMTAVLKQMARAQGVRVERLEQPREYSRPDGAAPDPEPATRPVPAGFER